MTREHGYILSTESNTVWRHFGKYVIIPKAQMEAAVRLWRREDFDIDAFDALCVLIADNEYHVDTNDPKASAGLENTATVEEAQQPRVSATVGFEEAQQLQVSATEADLEDGHKSSRPIGNWKQLQVWKMRQWLLEQASSAMSELSLGVVPKTRVRGQRQLSRSQLFRYLVGKIMKVRIFTDNSCLLYREFKVHVQVYMNQLAGLCNARVREIAAEPCGEYLCSFLFTHDRGVFVPAPAERPSAADLVTCGKEDTQAILRQDDDRVCAVRTGSDDVQERALERAGEPRYQLQPDHFGFREEVQKCGVL